MTDTTNRPLSVGRWIAGWAATAGAFGLLDGVWLGVVATGAYERAFGSLLADPVNVPAAVAFYGIYTLGITHFATAPGLRAGSVRTAALQGAALGVVAYAAFDLTSLAIIEGYPVRIVPLDMAWGTLATSLAAATATALLRLSRRRGRLKSSMMRRCREGARMHTTSGTHRPRTASGAMFGPPDRAAS